MNILFSTLFTSLLTGTMCFTMNGSTPPLGLFDPFKFTEKSEPNVLSHYREAELKHGRWAMIASSAIPLIESKTQVPAIHEFEKLSNNMQILIVLSIMAGEITVMRKGWKNPFEDNGANYFKLLDDYTPGDVGLGILAPDDSVFQNKELNNGRLAMIGSIGMIVQELATGKPLFTGIHS